MNSSSTYGDTEVFGAAIIGALVLCLIVFVVFIFCGWGFYKKLGYPGWYSVIPIFNKWKLYEAIGILPWLSLIALIPVLGEIADLAISIIAYVRLSSGFGKNSSYAILLFFFTPIVMAVLGYGSSTWDPSKIDYNAVNFINDKNNPHVNGDGHSASDSTGAPTVHDFVDTTSEAPEAQKAEDSKVTDENS